MSRDALERARRLRKGETEAERAAWNLLRNRQRLGHKFRRQLPLEKHIADFCCLELRLIIELDGSVHAQPSRRHRDETRDRELQRQGFRVLHISNGLVLNNPEGFIEKVEAAIVSLDPSPPSPSPARGEGRRIAGRGRAVQEQPKQMTRP